ncbi:hypothetical protein BGV03_18570, partial [Clostridioides difficile]
RLSGGFGKPGFPNRKLCGDEGLHFELAVAGHALLSAHRQEAARPHQRDGQRLPRAAPFDLGRQRRAQGHRACHSPATERGYEPQGDDQGTGAGRDAAGAGAAGYVFRGCAWHGWQRYARCLRTADHGRDPGQPDPVHARGRGRGRLVLD